MFEVLSLIGVMLIAASMLRREDSRKAREQDPARREAPAPAAAPRPDLVVRRAGDADGTHAVPRDARFAFVSGFGVRPDHLKELHVYSVAGYVEEFPQRVAELLHRLYDNGYAVGEEIMAVLKLGRPLKEGEAIYVAVARDDRSSVTRTVAFLDRRRAC